jgi:5,10-methylene-tetrahydrofolate dehydrogenase/methenyl tetrahydrofolate cyclohydrolase
MTNIDGFIVQLPLLFKLMKKIQWQLILVKMSMVFIENFGKMALDMTFIPATPLNFGITRALWS